MREGYGDVFIVLLTSVYMYRIIVDKIDKDGDGKVTMDELKNWVKHVSMR